MTTERDHVNQTLKHRLEASLREKLESKLSVIEWKLMSKTKVCWYLGTATHYTYGSPRVHHTDVIHTVLRRGSVNRSAGYNGLGTVASSSSACECE